MISDAVLCQKEVNTIRQGIQVGAYVRLFVRVGLGTGFDSIRLSRVRNAADSLNNQIA